VADPSVWRSICYDVIGPTRPFGFQASFIVTQLSATPGARGTANRRGFALRAALRAGAGVALVVYVVKTGGAWPSFADLPAALWLLVVLNLGGLLGAATEARRLIVLLRAQEVQLSFPLGFRLVCVATLFNLWIPGGTGGDVIKLYYLAGQNRGRGIELATLLIVDRVIALFALLVLILGMLAFEPHVLQVPVIRGLAAASGLALVLLSACAAGVWSTRIRNTRVYHAIIARPLLGRCLGRAADAAHAFRNRKRALLSAAVWCLAGHLVLAASFALTASVLLPSVSSFVAGTLSLLGIVANVLPVTPGGMGVGEAATEALFRAVGTSGGAILMVMWRASTAGICALGGAFFLHEPIALPRVASPEAAQ
jgi:uncharacterized protein (TIRG00374 family)